MILQVGERGIARTRKFLSEKVDQRRVETALNSFINTIERVPHQQCFRTLNLACKERYTAQKV